MTTVHAFHPYSIGGGGLVSRLDAWLRLPPDAHWAWRRRARLYIVVAYVPTLVVSIVSRLGTGQWDPTIVLFETHVRSLLAAPLLLLAEHVIDVRARVAGAYLVDAEIIRGDDVAAYARAVERTERLRNSVSLDALLLLLATASHWLDASTLFWVRRPAHFWGSFLAITLFRYLLFRWLWHWGLWATFLVRVSRMPLALSSIHPDRAGGLGVLAGPTEGFGVVAAAGAATLAAAWFDRMREGVALSAFYGTAGTYVVVMVGLALAPILVFSLKLQRLRKEGRFRYGAFAQRYCEGFQRRWFDRSGDAALGTPDLQSLADLGASYDVMSQMRIVVCDRRMLLSLIGASVVPMLPLTFAEFGVGELILRVVKALA